MSPFSHTAPETRAPPVPADRDFARFIKPCQCVHSSVARWRDRSSAGAMHGLSGSGAGSHRRCSRSKIGRRRSDLFATEA